MYLFSYLVVYVHWRGRYSRDMALLNSTIYPFIRDNAEFYASYSRLSPSGTVVLLYTCGQEQCVCRDFGRSDLWPNETLQCTQPDAPSTVRCDIPAEDANRSKCRGCLPDITVPNPRTSPRTSHSIHFKQTNI